MKRAFVPKRGAFVFADYSQIEPRLFAYFSAKGLGDTTVADWYREGRDVYREIAGKAMGKPASEITEEERQLGKVWFLMSLYGAGPRKMAAEIGMSEKEARDFYVAFHEGLPQIKGLSNPPPKNLNVLWTPGLVERSLRRRGYLKTPFGMHLHPEQYGEHKMLNKLIQGTAALVMKRALIRVDHALANRWAFPLAARMVATIHDEIIFDAPPGEVDDLAMLVPGLMTDEPEITTYVPLAVDIEVSTTSWAEKQSYEEWRKVPVG